MKPGQSQRADAAVEAVDVVAGAGAEAEAAGVARERVDATTGPDMMTAINKR